MVTFKLIDLTDKQAKYEYYPEGHESAGGVIVFDRVLKEKIVLAESKEDFGNRYAYHALRRIEEYAEKEEFQETGMVAWY